MVQDRLELDTKAGPCMGQVDWQVEICRLYWLLIGPKWSRDLDTGLWLVQSDHMTWILASDWSSAGLQHAGLAIKQTAPLFLFRPLNNSELWSVGLWYFVLRLQWDASTYSCSVVYLTQNELWRSRMICFPETSLVSIPDINWLVWAQRNS